MHGGKNTQKKGNQNGLKHGIYAKGMTEEEVGFLDHITVDHLDDEIRLCKLRIRRALIARKEIEENPESLDSGFEITEVKRFERRTAVGEKEVEQRRRELTTKRPDFESIIDRYMGRLNGLIRTRAELLHAAGKDPAEVAQVFQDAMEEIEANTTGGK
jgi:hypothetical protein